MEKTVYSKSKAPPPISHREDTPTEEQGTHRTREKSKKSGETRTERTQDRNTLEEHSTAQRIKIRIRLRIRIGRILIRIMRIRIRIRITTKERYP